MVIDAADLPQVISDALKVQKQALLRVCVCLEQQIISELHYSAAYTERLKRSRSIYLFIRFVFSEKPTV